MAIIRASKLTILINFVRDCLENIFTNIEKKRSYNNLLGMESNSIIDGVEILRPMLKISKNKIIFLRF